MSRPIADDPFYHSPEPEWDTLDSLHRQMRWLTVYYVTRHYGGPEEGGWWYDHKKLLCSVPCTFSEWEEREALLESWFKQFEWGSLNSMLGGVQIRIYPEYNRGESETKERPHYE